MWGLWIWTLVAVAGVPTGQGYGNTRYEYTWVYHTSFKTEKRCREVGREVSQTRSIYRGDVTNTALEVKCRKLD